MAVVVDTHELAWAAGFFDGEGHATSNRGNNYGLELGVCQAGPLAAEVIERFRNALFGMGTVNHYQPPGNRKYRIDLKLRNFEHAQAAAGAMWKYLSPVGRTKILQAVAKMRDHGRYRPNMRCEHDAQKWNGCEVCDRAYHYTKSAEWRAANLERSREISREAARRARRRKREARQMCSQEVVRHSR